MKLYPIAIFCILILVISIPISILISPISISTSIDPITWESDVQITSTGSESFFPTLAVDGSTIHLAWVDMRHGGENREIYYTRSTDSGMTWQVLDTRISNDPLHSIRTCFTVNGDAVNLFWRDNRDDNFEEYFSQSTDGGLTWGPERRLTYALGTSGCPFPAVNGDTLHLFFRDDRDGDYKIYYKRSDDAGANWCPDTVLTPDGIKSEFPFPAIDGETIHLVWRDYRDGNAEIYYKCSKDGGNTWKKDKRLTDDLGESEHPKIIAQGDMLHVVWRDDRDGNYEVYYKRSNNGGKNWSEDIRLTNTPGQSFWPVLGANDDILVLLWCDDSDGGQALYYKFSLDSGISWSDETRLSDCVAVWDLMGAHPIVVTDSYVQVVFNDNRTGANEIYYKRGTISTSSDISFSGRILISRVYDQDDPVIDWRIVVKGTIIMDGTEYTGTYTVVKLPEEAEPRGPIVPDQFVWSVKKCLIRIEEFDLTVTWDTEPPTKIFENLIIEYGDVITLNGYGREAYVTGSLGYEGEGYVAIGTGTISFSCE